jgi:hypothetical protein
MITSKEKQQKFVQEMHECPIGGHQSFQRTYDRLKLFVTWPGIFHDVDEYITNFKVCQQNKFTGSYVKAPFQETDTQFHPWDKLYLDIVGPLPMTAEGHKYVLTCQDNLSKYLLAIPMMTQTAEKVALNFMRFIVLQYGIPCSIVTDQGTQFMGNVFKRLCKLLRVHKLNTSPYRPESNGSLEKTNKTMVEYLRCFCDPRGSDWNKWLPFARFVYNTTPHTMTKYTPLEILFGRKGNVPGQLQ